MAHTAVPDGLRRPGLRRRRRAGRLGRDGPRRRREPAYDDGGRGGRRGRPPIDSGRCRTRRRPRARDRPVAGGGRRRDDRAPRPRERAPRRSRSRGSNAPVGPRACARWLGWSTNARRRVRTHSARAAASREQARRAGIDVDDASRRRSTASPTSWPPLTALLPAERLLDDLRRAAGRASTRSSTAGGEDELARAEADVAGRAAAPSWREVAQAADEAAAALPGGGGRARATAAPSPDAHDDARPADRRARDGLGRARRRPCAPWSTCARCCSTSANAGSPGWPPSSPVGWSSAATARSAVPTDHPHPAPSARPHTPTPTPSARLSERSTTHRPSSCAQQLRVRDVATALAGGSHDGGDGDRRRSSAPSSPRPGAPSTRCVVASPRASPCGPASPRRPAAPPSWRRRPPHVRSGPPSWTPRREHLRARVSRARGAGRGGARRASRAARGGRVAHRPPRADCASVEDDATALEAASESLADATTALGRAVLEAGFDTSRRGPRGRALAR